MPMTSQISWPQIHGLPEYQPASTARFKLINKQLEPDIPVLCWNASTQGLQLTSFSASANVPMLLEKETSAEPECIWMSVTQLELATIEAPLSEARGDVLTSGLGMGVFAQLAIRDPAVTSITIVEAEQEIIDLFSDYVDHPRVTIIHARLEDYVASTPPAFDYAFIDLWPFCNDSFYHETTIRQLCHRVMRPHSQLSVWMQQYNDRLRVIERKVLSQDSITLTDQTCFRCGQPGLRANHHGICSDCAFHMLQMAHEYPDCQARASIQPSQDASRPLPLDSRIVQVGENRYRPRRYS